MGHAAAATCAFLVCERPSCCPHHLLSWPQGMQQYSVLIRGQVGTPASDPEGTQELYR